jgi:soluble lytic murein transglycosylase-like protein
MPMGKRAIWVRVWFAGAAVALVLPASAQITAHRDRRGVVVYTNDGAPAAAETSVRRSLPSLHKMNPKPRQSRFAPLVRRVAKKHHLDPRLVEAVIHVESDGNPRAVSAKGAAGLMQLIPATAKRFGVENRFDPAENVRGGVSYLDELVKRFHGDLRKALAAYYAGEGAVERAGSAAPTADTAEYVRAVMKAYYRSGGRTAASKPGANRIYATVDEQGNRVFTNQ